MTAPSKFLLLSCLLSLIVCPLKATDAPTWPDSFHQPFWRKKPDVEKRMKDDGIVVVSAETEKIQDKPILFEMKVVSGGDVPVPLDFAFHQVTDYDNLKVADSHFRQSKYDKKANTLFIEVAALGYHADMNLKLHEIDKGKTREIHWECFDGTFKGMKGVLQLVEIERQKTEISMTADYRSEKLPLPKVLMAFGLEIVGRQVASQLQKYIKEQYQK